WLQILKIGDERRNLLPAAMRSRQSFGFVEDIRLGVNFQRTIRQTHAAGNAANSNDRCGNILRYLQCLERLFTELQSKWNIVFMKKIAQTLGHAESTRQQNDLIAVSK